MPSASNVKVDNNKQVPPENALADPSGSSLSPLRQVITLVEHKIRNLEKRKSKLESYRELQQNGKELNADQKIAVDKFNEVIQTLEFARDINKQVIGIASTSEREAKKQAKKEAVAKNQAELARLREILLVQDALNQMGNDTVRDDFLHGRNGAAQLTEGDLKLLDDLYPSVTPKHETGNPTAFANEIQAAAEHLLAVVDGKPKEVFGGTYCQVKEVLGKIHESGYFDQAVNAYGAFTEEAAELPDVSSTDVLLNHEVLPHQPISDPQISLPQIEMLSMETIPAPAAMLQQQQAPPPQLQQPPQQEALQSLDQQAVLQQQQQQQQPLPDQQQQLYYQPLPPQPSRPITEIVGTGSFYFLQDSEIDTPPEQISTQTYTNQTFVSGPPPPIPLPPMYQGMPQQTIVKATGGNNGLEDVHNVIGQHNSKDEMSKSAGSGFSQGGGGRPPRPGNNPSYYQNNNNVYNNRPRQSRNAATASGSRPGNNRHN